jgi:hypothetical protein
VSGPVVRRARPLLAALVATTLLLATPVTGRAAAPRLLVMDLPYARVWEGTVRALGEYALIRASEGVIETARTERPPRPDERDVDRVAERITVRVEAMAEKVTRVTVAVEAEGLRDGRWQALDGSATTVRTVLDRIRAGIG